MLREPKDKPVRTFIAVEIPADIKAAIKGVQDSLRKSGADVSWVRMDGIHLTLKFLGDIEPGMIKPLGDAVRASVSSLSPFTLKVAGAGVFPNSKAPRVVWVGLTGDVDALKALQLRIESACEALGFAREARPFKPHLTLGRVKSPSGRNALMREMAALAGVELGSFTADGVSVIKSDLKPSGAVYTELERICLMDTR